MLSDKYAIMADVHEQEIDYRRRNYGIHLLGYNTVELPDITQNLTSPSEAFANGRFG